MTRRIPQYRLRYHPWSLDEDARLCEHVAEGNSLSSATKILPGRTRGAIMGRWMRLADWLEGRG